MVSKNLKDWRAKQKKGAIMESSTFDSIVKENEKKHGKETAQKIAGKAYWNTAESKHKKSKK